MNHPILVVDDEAHQRNILTEFLASLGHPVTTAGSAAEGLQALKQDPNIHIVLTDLSMPKMNGIELIEAAKQLRSGIDFFVVTAHGTIETAIQAIRAGAFDYLMKPLELEEVRLRLKKLAELRSVQARVNRLEAENQTLRGDFSSTAVSAEMKRVIDEVVPVASTDATVLILGETGTGKEVLARHIHSASRRASGAFIAVNCSAIPEDLLESELFGHEKGAYTGADRLVQGCFERAHGGTLFLDEIAEMDLKLQAKILRAIEEKKIRRVGGGSEFPVDFRLLAATHQDLRKRVAEGRFREDLFYRLNVVSITLPPLRDRREDLPELVSTLVQRSARSLGVRVPAIDPSFLEALASRRFPGNVRELSNLIERAMIYMKSGRLTGDLLSAEAPSATPAPSAAVISEGSGSLNERLAAFEQSLISQTLSAHGGDVDGAAASLGVSRSSLYAKISKYGIRQ